MEQSLINSLEIFKEKLAHISDFFLKKRFFRKLSKPGHGNLVLITLIVQVELSKLDFNYRD